MFWFKLKEGKIERATKDAAAFDVFYSGAKPVYVGDAPVLLQTGIFTEFDPRLVAILKEKSGLGVKGLEVKAGVIDADYRKEWCVVARFPIHYELPMFDSVGKVVSSTLVVKEEWKPLLIKPGQAIAQFLLIEKPAVEIQWDSDFAQVIEEGKPRTGGFGSTDASKAHQ